jgi:hypothetical protein
MTAAPAVTAGPEPVQPRSFTAPELLARLWLVGSLASGLWLLGVNLRFGQRLKSARRPLQTGRLPVYVAPGVASPCLFGLFRPAVYLTPACEEGPEERRQQVLLHEEIHYKQMDHIWGSLRCLALAVWWWNPLVWLAAACSRRDGELSCDEKVMARLGEEARLDYGRTLVDLLPAKAPRPMLSAATLSGGARAMKQRLERIVKKPRLWVHAAAAVLLLAAFAVCCAFAGKPEDARRSSPGAAPDAPSEAEGSEGKGAPVPTDYGVYTEEGFLDLRVGQTVYGSETLREGKLELHVINRSETPVLYRGPGLQLWLEEGWKELPRRPGFELSEEGKRIEGGETLPETVDPAAFDLTLAPGRYRFWLNYSVGGDPRAAYDWTVFAEFEIAEGGEPPAPAEGGELLMGSAKPEKVDSIEYRLNVYDHYFLDRGDMGFDTALDIIFSLRGTPCEKPEGLLVSRSFTLDGVPDISLAFDGDHVYARRFADRWFLLDAPGRPDRDLTDIFVYWGREEEPPEIDTLPAAYGNRIEDGSLTIEAEKPVFDLAVMRASFEQLRVLYRNRGEEPPELVRDLMVTVRVTNHTEEAIDVSYDLGLEALRDGEWRYIPWREGLASMLMAHNLGPGEEVSGLGISMLNYYEEALTPGRYRVCLPYRLRLDKGGSEHVAYAEFEIVDGPQPEKVYIPMYRDYPATESHGAYHLSFRVPAGWSEVTMRPEEAAQQGILYLYNGTEDRHYIRDESGKIIGAYGCASYGEAEGAEDLPGAVYAGIALGNGYRFDVLESYAPVAADELGERARVKVYYSQAFLRPFMEQPEERWTEGFLSYDRALGVYAAVELEPGVLTEEEMDTLARSLHMEHEEPESEAPAPVTEQEVLAAYDAAREAYGWFVRSSIPDGAFVDRTDLREDHYYRVTDSRFDTWETLESYLLSLFDETIVQNLLPGAYKEIGGHVYVTSADAGGDITVGELTELRVVREGEGRFTVSATYERMDLGYATPMGFSTYEFPYVWQGDRWAFESFRLPEYEGGSLPEPTPEPTPTPTPVPMTTDDPRDWLPLAEGEYWLPDEEVEAWQRWFDEDRIRPQFLRPLYGKPEDVDMSEVFYNGLGIPVTGEDVRASLLHLGQWITECPTDKLPRQEMSAVLEEYLGLTLSETWKVGLDWPYFPETDSYYHPHGDTNAMDLRIICGARQDDMVRLFYNSDSLRRVELDISGGNVRFVSNMESVMTVDGVIGYGYGEPLRSPGENLSGDYGLDITVLTPEPEVFGSFEEAVEATENMEYKTDNPDVPEEEETLLGVMSITWRQDLPGYGALLYGEVAAGLPHGNLKYLFFLTEDGRRYSLPIPLVGFSEVPLDLSVGGEAAIEGRGFGVESYASEGMIYWWVYCRFETNPALGSLPLEGGYLRYTLYLPTMEVFIWFQPEE